MASARTKGAEFISEVALVARLLSVLRSGRSPWGPVDVETEWNYVSGSTDVLICTRIGEIVAFEAKLRDWRTAMHQAYRNTTFARRAFVVMPPEAAARAAMCAHDFVRRGIGLIAFGRKDVQFLIDAPRVEDPLISPWMHEQARAHFAQLALRRESRTARGARRDLQAA